MTVDHLESDPARFDDRFSRSTVPGPALHFAVPVWGTAYIEFFVKYCLPSQLASGNLPGIPSLERCVYRIFTRSEETQLIVSAPSFRRLSRLIRVELVSIDDPITVPHDTMSECYRQAVAAADDADAATVFLTPDFIWADGSFVSLSRIAASGKRVVHMTGVRLLKESVVPVLNNHLTGGGTELVFRSRDLVKLAIAHLHPISRNHFWGGDEGPLIPANLFWAVGAEGLLLRCFHLHPLMVYPERKHVKFSGTVDDDFALMACPGPGSDYIVMDSDELLACEVSSSQHRVESNFRKGSVDDVVEWAEANTNARHRELVCLPIRFHADVIESSRWQSVEAEADAVVASILLQLRRPGWKLALTAPMMLVRRLVKRARDYATESSNTGLDGKLVLAAQAATTMYEGYRGFCRAYLGFRERLDDWIFGPSLRPRAWSSGWLLQRQLAAELARLEAAASSEQWLLVRSDQAAIERLLQTDADVTTLGFCGDPMVVVDIEQQHPWPLPNDCFNTVICAGALAIVGDADFVLAEIRRLLRPGGRAILLAPFLQRSGEFWTADFRRLSVDGLLRRIPDGIAANGVQKHGGIGTVLGGLFMAWAATKARTLRLSPVILEIPLLPIILPGRVAGNLVVNLLAMLLDRADNTGRFYTGFRVELIKEKAEANPASGSPAGGGPAH